MVTIVTVNVVTPEPQVRIIEVRELNGPAGASAYAIALANGFVGTEAEWLASLQGADGDGSAVYTHNQGGESNIWTVNHNLGFRPTITVFDATGNPVNAGIAHTNLNQAIISFVIPIAGSARCT